jgi:hypothetical protein
MSSTTPASAAAAADATWLAWTALRLLMRATTGDRTDRGVDARAARASRSGAMRRAAPRYAARAGSTPRSGRHTSAGIAECGWRRCLHGRPKVYSLFPPRLPWLAGLV